MQPSDNGAFPPVDGGFSVAGDDVSLVVDQVVSTSRRATVRRGELRGPGGFQKHATVKTLPTSLFDLPESKNRIVSAVSQAAQVGHPAIAQIYDAALDDDGFSIVSELVEGHSISQIVSRAVQRGIPLPTHIIVWVLRSVADALIYVQDAAVDELLASRLAHGHLHPNNILVRADGQVKVTDFGLATAIGPAMFVPGPNEMTGAFGFMPPEQVQRWQIDERTDVYSLGALLYFLALCEVPFQGRSDAEVCQAIARGLTVLPTQRFPDFPPALESIIARCLAIDPDHRFQTVQQFRAELIAVMEGDATQASRASMAAIIGILFPEESVSTSGRWQRPTTSLAKSSLTQLKKTAEPHDHEREERLTWIIGFAVLAVVSLLFWLLIFPLL